MKNNQLLIKPLFKVLFALFISTCAFAQNDSVFSICNEENFTNKLLNENARNSSIELELPHNEILQVTINVREISSAKDYFVAGRINDVENGSFSITKTNGLIEGQITLYTQNKGYKYMSGDSGDILIEEVQLEKLLCIGVQNVNADNSSAIPSNSDTRTMVPILNSLPGATATIYLDFDGEVVSGTSWNGGATINAQPEGYSDSEMRRIWELVAEDFSPFNVNVTTDRSVFDNAPRNRRMMNIFTTTTTAAPGSGGVAYLNSFSRNNNDPCWTFNGRPGSIKAAAETASHEVGHTVGLSHDGQGSNTYYQGDGTWCPIMGGNFTNPVGHWSKGEYSNANLREDDLAIITRARNFGYKSDDHGGSANGATEIVVNSQGTVEADDNRGVIERNSDKDFFSFETAGGAVEFEFNPASRDPNLNIGVKIYNASNQEVASSSPANRMSASIDTTLPGGTYFIEVDGVAGESSSGGYTNYGSIGVYSISGSYNAGNNNQAPVANFTGDILCNEVTFRSTSINTVTSYLWDFGDGNTSTQESPTHVYQTSGSYDVSLTASNAIGSDTKTITDFVIVEIASLPDSASASICEGANESIELTGSNGYVWYDQATGGNIVNTGSTLDLSGLTANETYYVAGTTDATLQGSAGEENITNANGGIHQGGFYLVFDAIQPFLLRNAKVFAEGTANRTLELRDAAGTIIASKVINIENGESIIDINVNVPAGTDLQVGFADGAQLFRSNAGLNYPYNLDNVVSIKGSTATSNPVGFYYYLYDWKISTLGNCQTDDRTEVIITVNQPPAIPVITFNQSTGVLSTPDNYDNYQWFKDGVAIAGANGPTYTASENGQYTLEVSNGSGSDCTAISEIEDVTTLSVSDFIKGNFKVFPNPMDNTLTIVKNAGINLINAKIHDVNGRLIKVIDLSTTIEQRVDISVSELSSGMYFMNIASQEGQGTIKILKK